MKVCVLILTMTTASVFAFSSEIGAWQSLGGQMGEQPLVNVMEADNNHLLLDISIPGFWLSSYPGGGAIWDRITLPGYFSPEDIGRPDLPFMANLFALPYGTQPIVTIENIEFVEYHNLSIHPCQTPEIDMPHAEEPFRIDDAFYQQDVTYPDSRAYVDNEGFWAGLRVARLVVNPFSYNPASEELSVARKIRVRVDFAGPPEMAHPVNPSFAPAMSGSVVNWSAFRSSVAVTDVTDTAGIEYIFIVNSSTNSAVSDLVSTYQTLGFETEIVSLSNPTTSAAIKSAIEDNYDTASTRFVLIAGDHTAMPPYSGYAGFVSDFYFALLDGGDNYPDVAVGRLTGSSSQIEHQVDKILDGYINYSFDDAGESVPATTVLAAHQQDYPGKYTACCNEIAEYDYSQLDITFHKVYAGDEGTNTDVSNHINEGIGTVGYRGHGSQTTWSWAAPGSWTIAMIGALTNDFMPPVFNIACHCGAFNSGSTCLCEAWQWEDGGASGNLGANIASYTTTNHSYMKRIYRGIYDSGLFNIGEAINYAAVYIINNHGASGLKNARMYFWFGDPAMEIWTTDGTDGQVRMEISAPGSVAPGSQTIVISVTDGTDPLEGIEITLTDGISGSSEQRTIHETITTNSAGQVSFHVQVPDTDILMVGAHRHNHLPAFAKIPVGTTGTEDLCGATTPSILSLGCPVPNPIRASAAISFSLSAAGMTEMAVFDITGRKVETLVNEELGIGCHSIGWQPDESIASGVYFIRLDTPDGTLTRQAMVIR